ncbi:MAG: DNA polymerase IV [Oscillospiraceae bacterium]|nr:DNA polymerase IV [Oscillospiraceae bacterium]
MNQIILHVDMDAFYASVEVRDDPSLRGKPLIIGSLPSERGVVATCSYEARKFGVHSGMNIKDAYRLCPQGIYRHPDFDKYTQVSRQLREIWRSYAADIETIALDEAYLDLTERAGVWETAREIAREIKRRTREELHLSCSVGLAYSKTAAKTASEEKKPDGYFEILTAEDFVKLILDRDVQVLYTVGEKTAQKLHAAGIRTVREVRERQEDVIRLLGKQGHWITQIAFGVDDRKVTPYRPEEAKSIGRELTFQEDVNDYAFLREVLFLLALSVEYRVRRVGLHGKGVSLKLTYANMKGITRSRIVPDCDDAVTIYREALKLLEQVEPRPVRLIGVSLYNLSGEEGRQLSLEDLLGEEALVRKREQERLLAELGEHYHLDFAGHLEQLYHSQTLHKTVEYMRKHK